MSESKLVNSFKKIYPNGVHDQRADLIFTEDKGPIIRNGTISQSELEEDDDPKIGLMFKDDRRSLENYKPFSRSPKPFSREYGVEFDGEDICPTNVEQNIENINMMNLGHNTAICIITPGLSLANAKYVMATRDVITSGYPCKFDTISFKCGEIYEIHDQVGGDRFITNENVTLYLPLGRFDVERSFFYGNFRIASSPDEIVEPYSTVKKLRQNLIDLEKEQKDTIDEILAPFKETLDKYTNNIDNTRQEIFKLERILNKRSRYGMV